MYFLFKGLTLSGLSSGLLEGLIINPYETFKNEWQLERNKCRQVNTYLRELYFIPPYLCLVIDDTGLAASVSAGTGHRRLLGGRGVFRRGLGYGPLRLRKYLK